jgi:hypothetical protein
MNILTRSMIAAVTLGGLLTAAATPASAIVGGRDASQTYPGMTALSVSYPGIGTAQCGAMLIHPRFLLTQRIACPTRTQRPHRSQPSPATSPPASVPSTGPPAV